MVPEALTALDRCDRCGSQAYVVTSHAGRLLYHCTHHFKQHEAALRPHVVLDERQKLSAT